MPTAKIFSSVALLALLSHCGGVADHSSTATGGSAGLGGGGTSPGSGGMNSGGARGGSGGTQPTGGGSAGQSTIDPYSVQSFESDNVYVDLGLWMGFPNDKLPIELPEQPHDAEALHLVGSTGPEGLDVLFHTSTPVEVTHRGVVFWARADEPNTPLTVAIAGPYPLYFADRDEGVDWPHQTFNVTSDWQRVQIDFDDLGIGPDALSPRSGPFGAVHFIVEPNSAYDFWIDDFALLER